MCGCPVRGHSEHVLPKWLLARYRGAGPYTTYRGTRATAVHDHLVPVKLQLCRAKKDPDGRDCNTWLNRHFEQPAQPYLTSLLHGRAIRGQGVTFLARWLVKTLLLLAHPGARYTDSRIRRELASVLAPWQREELEPMLFALRSTGRLPRDLSLWTAIIDSTAVNGPPTPDEIILLPTLLIDHRRSAESQFTSRAFGMDDGRELAVQLLHHPHLNVEHPFVTAGLAVQLWPDPPDEFDPDVLPSLDSTGAQHLYRLFCMGGDCIDMESLQPQHRDIVPGLISPFLTAR